MARPTFVLFNFVLFVQLLVLSSSKPTFIGVGKWLTTATNNVGDFVVNTVPKTVSQPIPDGVSKWVTTAADNVGDFVVNTVPKTISQPIPDGVDKRVNTAADDVVLYVVETVADNAESTPGLGHGIAVAYYISGNNKKGDQVMKDASSNTASTVGGAFGVLCGPGAVVCSPVLAALLKTQADAAITLIDGQSYGNIEYINNFNNKDFVDHAEKVLDTLLGSTKGHTKGKQKIINKIILKNLRETLKKKEENKEVIGHFTTDVIEENV